MATPVEVPAVVDRRRWPVHVTVAGNFRVDDAHADAVSARFASVARDAEAFDVVLGPVARFGAARDIPVLLAEHPAFHRIHNSLAVGLARIPGFTAVEPAFWGSGYRPHATLGSAVEVGDGDSLTVGWLTLVSLEGHLGHRISAIRLRRPDDQIGV